MRSGRGALIWDNATASACCMIHTDGRLIPVIYEPGEAGAPDPEVFVRVARTSRRLTRRSSRRDDHEAYDCYPLRVPHPPASPNFSENLRRRIYSLFASPPPTSLIPKTSIPR